MVFRQRNSQRFEMDMSAADVKRASMALPQATQSTEPNGSEILVRCLQAEGVKYLWGYPGGAVLYIYDALFKQDSIQHVLVRHEQAAVHAADGYARATGDVGVALVTSGPGVTNAVTGIATAYMDSIPMVIITGQVPTPAIGLDAFQECDTVGITRPIVKHNFLVKDVRDLAVTLKKAFHIARTGRPGPVVVDIPKDVSQATAAFSYPTHIEMRSYNPARKGHAGQIRKAVQLLMTAKRPYIYTGGGVILGNASAELRELVDLLGYPCTNTLMGLGAYPASDPKFLGMLGMHGTYEANMSMQHCDVLLAVGARFDDRVIGDPKHFAAVERKIVHIDIDPSSISKRVRVDVPIVGDVKDVLQELIAQIKEGQARPDAQALASWWGQINTWRARECLKYKTAPDVIKPQAVVEALWNMTKDSDAYITSDVGQHQMWAAQYYRFDEPRRWINSGGLGTMGVGLPLCDGHQAGQAGSRCVLHHRRRLDPDVHPGAFHLPAVQDAGEDRRAQQSLSRHGASVAGTELRQALLTQLYGRAARFRQTGRSLRPCGSAGGETRRRGAGAARSHQAEGSHRVSGRAHRSYRERLADGAGR